MQESPHSRKPALHGTHHLAHATFGEHFHHLLGFFKLLEHTIDFLHLDTCTSGDPALAGGFDDLRLASLDRRHGIDDTFYPADGFITDLTTHLPCHACHLCRQFIHQ